jgi:hypothetical protein
MSMLSVSALYRNLTGSVRLTVGSDGGQPAEALAVKAGDLLVGDDAHG